MDQERRNCYIALDLETTGLSPKMDKIIEIGAVRIRDGEIDSEFSCLVNPGRELEEGVSSLTGITGAMLAKAPAINLVIGDFLNFCKDDLLLGHQILFDYSFIKRAAVNSGHSFERQGIDTLHLCRLLMPEGEKKNLAAACHFFGIDDFSSHRALPDAIASHLLFQKLTEGFGDSRPEVFLEKPLNYKVKKEQPATKRQKEHLRDLIKYHRICVSVQIDSLSRNEISRMTDKIISQYGRIVNTANIKEVNSHDKLSG